MTGSTKTSKNCLSTHGSAGFAIGTCIQEGFIICGLCGEKIGTIEKNNYPSKKLPNWIE